MSSLTEKSNQGLKNSAELQAAREANPSESDLRIREQSARRGLKRAKINSAVWRECMAYIVACEVARKAPGTHMRVLLEMALETVSRFEVTVAYQPMAA